MLQHSVSSWKRKDEQNSALGMVQVPVNRS